MATAEQYAEWIVKNKDKQGSPEFETVAEAYKLARSETVATSVTEQGFFDESPLQKITKPQNIINPIGGVIGGAAKSLGALVSNPIDMAKAAIAGEGLTGARRNIADRRASIDAGLQSAGVDTSSLGYKGAELATEIAGTSGIPVALGGRVAKEMPRLGSAIQSGGLNLGGKAGGKVADMATRVAGGAASGGAMTLASSNPESAGTGAAIGAAIPVVGKVAGEAGKKIGRALTANVAPEVVKLAEKAKSLGINIPADRLTNSKPLNAVASSLNYIPFSGRAKTEELFEKQLNTALSKTFGQNTDNVTMGLRKASDDLGKAFDDTLKSNSVRFDKQLLDDIAETQNQAATELSDTSLQIVNRQIDDIIKKGESGVIDGQAAYNIKRTLDRIGRGNNPEAYHARQLKKDLMAGLDRSLGAEGAKEFAKVRKQYGTMMDLENIAQNGAEGGISIARLANMKNIKNSELQDLADIAAQFLKPRESQHGAMQRVLVGGLGVGSGVGAPALIGGAVAGRLTNKALNSEMAKKLALGQIKSPKVGNTAIGVARTVPIASLYD
jgi:hypothetical protein